MSEIIHRSHADVLAHDARIVRWLLRTHGGQVPQAHVNAQCWSTPRELINLGVLKVEDVGKHSTRLVAGPLLA